MEVPGSAVLLGLISGLSVQRGRRCHPSSWPLREEVSGGKAGQIQARDSPVLAFPSSLVLRAQALDVCNLIIKWGRVSLEMGGKCGLSHEGEELSAPSSRGQGCHVTQYFVQPCTTRNHSPQNASQGHPVEKRCAKPLRVVSCTVFTDQLAYSTVQASCNLLLLEKIFLLLNLQFFSY